VRLAPRYLLPSPSAHSHPHGQPSTHAPTRSRLANPRPDISITGHGAAHRNLLAVLGHQAYPLATGEMIPVVVRATLAGGAECHGE
jgi:hypothetical protein